jgi:hypothetical protein
LALKKQDREEKEFIFETTFGKFMNKTTKYSEN